MDNNKPKFLTKKDIKELKAVIDERRESRSEDEKMLINLLSLKYNLEDIIEDLHKKIDESKNKNNIITDSSKVKLERDLTIDAPSKIIHIINEINDQTLYTFMKKLWRNSDYFLKFYFPFVSILKKDGNVIIECSHNWKILPKQYLRKK